MVTPILKLSATEQLLLLIITIDLSIDKNTPINSANC